MKWTRAGFISDYILQSLANTFQMFLIFLCFCSEKLRSVSVYMAVGQVGGGEGLCNIYSSWPGLKGGREPPPLWRPFDLLVCVLEWLGVGRKRGFNGVCVCAFSMWAIPDLWDRFNSVLCLASLGSVCGSCGNRGNGTWFVWVGGLFGWVGGWVGVGGCFQSAQL